MARAAIVRPSRSFATYFESSLLISKKLVIINVSQILKEDIMETETLGTSQEMSKAKAPKDAQQKNAVYNLALAALNAEPKEGVSLRSLVTKEVRKTIRQGLFAAIKAGTVKLARPMDDSKLKKYCSSLINNWLKKDSRFN